MKERYNIHIKEGTEEQNEKHTEKQARGNIP